MKRTILILLTLMSLSVAFPIYGEKNCGTQIGTDTLISDALKECSPSNSVKGGGVSRSVFGGFLQFSNGNDQFLIENAKDKVYSITLKLVILAAIFAIGGLVYAGIQFVTYYGDDNKLKKAKETVKWSLLGLLIAIISQQLINGIVNLIYAVSNN